MPTRVRRCGFVSFRSARSSTDAAASFGRHHGSERPCASSGFAATRPGQRMSLMGRERRFAKFGCGRSGANSSPSTIDNRDWQLSPNSDLLDAFDERLLPR